MKMKLMTLLASLTLVLPAMAQTTVIGGDINNGNLETPLDSAPFLPPGGLLTNEQDHTTGSGMSLKIDLTANNGAGQWKGWADNGANGIEADVVPGQTVSAGFWVYVPSETTFGEGKGDGSTVGPNKIVQYIELYNPTTDTWTGLNFSNLNLDTLTTRDAWVKYTMPPVTVESQYTKIRTRAWNLTTNSHVNGKEAFTPGGDPENKAEPSDWEAAGYSGAIYLDDISLVVSDPPPPGIGIEGNVRNGNIEALELTPFGARPYQSASTEFNHTPGGSKSLAIHLGGEGGNQQWKGITAGSNVTLLVNQGEVIEQSVWVYVPSGTVWPTDPTCQLLFRVNSNTSSEATGINTNLKTLPQGEWNLVTFDRPVEAGETQVTTSKWYITVGGSGGVDVEQFNGINIYLDDFTLTSKVQPPPPPLEIVVGPGINNGDMEADTLSPFNTAGGTRSTVQNHTPDGTSSLAIDLTANNSNGQWKGIIPGGINARLASDLDTVNMTAWVYIPASTSFGPTASLNLELRTNPGSLYTAGAPTFNLTTAVRDTWIKVEALGLPVAEGATQISLGNWNLATVAMVGANGDIPATSATPADWQAAGYSGSIFIDDVQVELIHPQGPDIVVNSIAYDDSTGDVTIEYSSKVGPIDVWKNIQGDLNPANFEVWDQDIDGGIYVDTYVDIPGEPRAFYVLVSAGEEPYPEP
ncbi:hypothetical protein ACFQY0_15405 [Haloferula chungangensis]|uniref:CBM-cenC domain-containing protein n=1 Tax=Haloferula chungangensis TaxID=1048331 RepID=A0ABW2L849_9BACT